MIPIDSRPSSSRWKVQGSGAELRWFLEVRGLGVITILVSSDLDDPKGKIKAERMGLLTIPEIDPEALEPPSPSPPDAGHPFP